MRLATPEVSTVTGGRHRIETTRATLPSRMINSVAPVRSCALAHVGAITEQCEARLAFLRSDPKGLDPAGYCPALDWVTQAVSLWGRLLGDDPHDLPTHNAATRSLLTAP